MFLYQPLQSCPGQTHEIQGYMPGRQEFDNEYENEAEVFVKDLQFDETDSQLDKSKF